MLSRAGVLLIPGSAVQHIQGLRNNRPRVWCWNMGVFELDRVHLRASLTWYDTELIKLCCRFPWSNRVQELGALRARWEDLASSRCYAGAYWKHALCCYGVV